MCKLVCELTDVTLVFNSVIKVLILVCVEVSMWGQTCRQVWLGDIYVLILVCVEVSMWANILKQMENQMGLES